MISLRVFDLLGVAVFAATGVLAAGRKNLDLLGVLVIAVVTAVGGGTLRDVLLSRHPVFWIADPVPLYVIVAATAVTVIYTRTFRAPGRLLDVADALGLALFTITGAQIAEANDVPSIVVIIMATMTGVAGGVIRDILTAEIPMILRGEIYATASIAGSAVYLVLQHGGVGRTTASLAGMSVVALLRLAAIAWRLRLPVFSLSDRTPRN